MGINIFLSSNSREGYSQDVVDLFAKPNGDRQQFRYSLMWVSSEVTNPVNWANERKGESALLCYIDQGTKNVTPKIVPVRFAKISEVREHGSTVSIVFELESLCKFDDLEKVNSYLRSQSTELPEFSNGELEGKYWLRFPNLAEDQCSRTDDLGDWERLVEFYYETPNAVDDAPFYRFEGLFELQQDKAIEATMSASGMPTYFVDGGGQYEVRVYHYHPKQHFPGFLLEVSTGDNTLESLNGERRTLRGGPNFSTSLPPC